MQDASRRWAAAAMRGALAAETVAFAQVLWRSHGGGDVHDLGEGHFLSQGHCCTHDRSFDATSHGFCDVASVKALSDREIPWLWVGVEHGQPPTHFPPNTAPCAVRGCW